MKRTDRGQRLFAVAHPVRLAALELLCERPRTGAEVALELGHRSIRHHLRILESSGLAVSVPSDEDKRAIVYVATPLGSAIVRVVFQLGGSPGDVEAFAGAAAQAVGAPAIADREIMAWLSEEGDLCSCGEAPDAP